MSLASDLQAKANAKRSEQLAAAAAEAEKSWPKIEKDLLRGLEREANRGEFAFHFHLDSLKLNEDERNASYRLVTIYCEQQGLGVEVGEWGHLIISWRALLDPET